MFHIVAKENVRGIKAYVTEFKEWVAKLQNQKKLLVCLMSKSGGICAPYGPYPIFFHFKTKNNLNQLVIFFLLQFPSWFSTTNGFSDFWTKA